MKALLNFDYLKAFELNYSLHTHGNGDFFIFFTLLETVILSFNNFTFYMFNLGI